MRMFEKMAMRICGPKDRMEQEDGEPFIMRSFIICTPHQMLLG
jgi:hypothetical protein